MTTRQGKQRTKVRRTAKLAIGDMIIGMIENGIDLSQYADLADTTEAALIAELRRQAVIMFEKGSRR